MKTKVGKKNKKITTCGYCDYDEATGNLIEQCRHCFVCGPIKVAKIKTQRPDILFLDDLSAAAWLRIDGVTIHSSYLTLKETRKFYNWLGEAIKYLECK